MPVRIDISDKTVYCYLTGELDQHSAKAIRQEIDAAVERIMPDKLALDFGGVTFMDSSGIGLVMGRYRLMDSLGGELALSGVTGHIRKVMRIAGLDKLAKFEDSSKTGTATGKEKSHESL